MPKYFVRIREGDKLLPDDGNPQEFYTLEQVREEAVAGARDILSETALEGKAGTLNQEVGAFDEQGEEVFAVPVGRATDTDTQD